LDRESRKGRENHERELTPSRFSSISRVSRSKRPALLCPLDLPERPPVETLGEAGLKPREHLHDADGHAQLEELAAYYPSASPPPQGGKATMCYRMRLLRLDWSENGLKTT
jgi:hypothetical protein